MEFKANLVLLGLFEVTFSRLLKEVIVCKGAIGKWKHLLIERVVIQIIQCKMKLPWPDKCLSMVHTFHVKNKHLFFPSKTNIDSTSKTKNKH